MTSSPLGLVERQALTFGFPVRAFGVLRGFVKPQRRNAVTPTARTFKVDAPLVSLSPPEQALVPRAGDTVLGWLPSVEPIPVKYAFAKRMLDVVFAIAFLAIMFVPMLVLALLVKLTSEGPALYSCTRVGLGGRPFRFLKFRSMRVDADDHLHALLPRNEKDGPIFKIAGDPRITPIGGFMRKFSLDEMPQMIHVLTGEMTLVGPRPPLPREVMLYTPDQLQRLSVKPALTCYWQINGRSNLSFEKWMELDRKYIAEMSFWTDLEILLRTPVAVFSGRGAC
ncbi:MAG: sugar transferase [Fimbriimonadales bacterium]